MDKITVKLNIVLAARIIVCLASNCSVSGFQRFPYAWIASVDDTRILKINSVAFEPRMHGWQYWNHF